MTTYFMFGKFSAGSLKDVSTERTRKATALVENMGGKVEAIYALLGTYDVVAIAEFADFKDAMKASVELSKMLGISFTTSPAVTVEEFDKLATQQHVSMP